MKQQTGRRAHGRQLECVSTRRAGRVGRHAGRIRPAVARAQRRHPPVPVLARVLGAMATGAPVALVLSRLRRLRIRPGSLAEGFLILGGLALVLFGIAAIGAWV